MRNNVSSPRQKYWSDPVVTEKIHWGLLFKLWKLCHFTRVYWCSALENCIYCLLFFVPCFWFSVFFFLIGESASRPVYRPVFSLCVGVKKKFASLILWCSLLLLIIDYWWYRLLMLASLEFCSLCSRLARFAHTLLALLTPCSIRSHLARARFANTIDDLTLLMFTMDDHFALILLALLTPYSLR